jgi:hypothetical protein
MAKARAVSGKNLMFGSFKSPPSFRANAKTHRALKASWIGDFEKYLSENQKNFADAYVELNRKYPEASPGGYAFLIRQ